MTTATLPLAGSRPRQGSPLREALRRLGPGPVAWTTVAVLAALMAYADGFVLTSLRAAVGVSQQLRGPFVAWLESSTLMLPLFVLAVLAALWFVRRRSGQALRSPRRVVAAALLIAVAGGVVGTGEVFVGLASDYHVQSQFLDAKAAAHGESAVAAPADPQAATSQAAPAAGTVGHASIPAQRAQQLGVVRDAARLGSGAVLVVNVVLVGWYLAFRGGRLERRRPLGGHPVG